MLRCKALNERAYAEQCQDNARRRRHLATALIAEELANYINDTSCLPETFWLRLQTKKDIRFSHIRLVIKDGVRV